MHTEIASEIIEYLHQKFPHSSIALAGSVANGTYKKNSDIDLLFINEHINNSYSISFNYKDIPISIFSFQKGIFHTHNYTFLYNYHNMPIAYIYNAKIIYDSEKIIFDLKNNIEEVFEKREILKSPFISELKENIEKLLSLNTQTYYEKKKVVYRIINTVISIFFLKRNNRGALVKTEAHDPFSVIKNKDFELYNILKECLPFHDRTYQMIKEAYYNYFSLNY